MGSTSMLPMPIMLIIPEEALGRYTDRSVLANTTNDAPGSTKPKLELIAASSSTTIWLPYISSRDTAIAIALFAGYR